ncbi:hypothetical protein ZHAS_00018511 [Anopheles sinensis]|uniref:Uncharacterized protein n=1 Tax=Anopheles sinensis TaxID=74873 RepID=A0A084WJT2_ANOSI|nr:hypothetical protein ZHAS_00018511 [Anopheles sinensis]
MVQVPLGRYTQPDNARDSQRPDTATLHHQKKARKTAACPNNNNNNNDGTGRKLRSTLAKSE